MQNYHRSQQFVLCRFPSYDYAACTVHMRALHAQGQPSLCVVYTNCVDYIKFKFMQLNSDIPLKFGNRPRDDVPGPPLATSYRTTSLLFQLRIGVFNMQVKLV